MQPKKDKGFTTEDAKGAEETCKKLRGFLFMNFRDPTMQRSRSLVLSAHKARHRDSGWHIKGDEISIREQVERDQPSFDAVRGKDLFRVDLS